MKIELKKRPTLEQYSVDELKRIAQELRIEVLEMLYRSQSGHFGGSYSAAEILTTLYYKFMRIDSETPQRRNRDRFILSKGHAVPILYALLARLGYFDKEELKRLRQLDSILQGHPSMLKTPGIDFSTGSLGHGLSVGCGMAIAAKMSSLDIRVYVMLGDGELDEGQTWEAAMSATKFKLDNLTAIVDYNNVQLDGKVEEIMPIEPLRDKWVSFNWNVIEIDGHDIRSIMDALEEAGCCKETPTVIIARTVKGKGVSFMEHKSAWHGSAVNTVQYETAKAELEDWYKRLSV
jgi:transketolase